MTSNKFEKDQRESDDQFGSICQEKVAQILDLEYEPKQSLDITYMNGNRFQISDDQFYLNQTTVKEPRAKIFIEQDKDDDILQYDSADTDKDAKKPHPYSYLEAEAGSF